MEASHHEVDQGRVRRLTPRDELALLRHLTRLPSQHAYLLGQLARGALADPADVHLFTGSFSRGALTGVASFGPNLVLGRSLDLSAVRGLARHARDLELGVRVIVGPDRDVEHFMDHFGREDVLLERAGQILLELDGRHLARSARSIGLRPAQPEELDEIWRLDHEMILEELGFTPFGADPYLHKQGCLRRIQEQRTWVEGPIGGLTFKVDQSAVSPHVVQLAGVYTARSARRRGIALQALGEMCHLLLREVPRVTLYVNDDNTTARRLYGRLGFREVGRVRSVWLTPHEAVFDAGPLRTGTTDHP